jgi:hypothetical protein
MNIDTSRFQFLADALNGRGVFRPTVTYDSAGRAASTGSTALVRYQRESEEKFARRNEVAWYENHLLSACRRFVGYIAKKPPLREIGHPLLEDFVADCDWRGNALDVFWQGFMVEARARGSMLLLVDMPRGEAATLADQREQRFFPYLVAIPPERIVAFALNDQGKIARVEIESVWDGKRAVKGWDAKRWWVRVDEREVDGDNHPLGVCPVLAFSESGDFPTFGDFAQIADISRRLFNARSELDEILRAQTFSILVAGYPADQAGARESLENAVIQIGTSNALVTPGQVAEFIAPPDGPASIYMDAIAKLEQAIDRASLNVEIPAEKQAESGIALTVRFQALNSALTSFARRMEDFERQVWEVASLWLGLPPERAAIRWAKDYAIGDAKAELEILSAMQMSGFPDAAVRLQQKAIAALVFAAGDPDEAQAAIAAIDESSSEVTPPPPPAP